MGIFEDIFNEHQKKIVLSLSIILFLIVFFDVVVNTWALL